MIIKNSITGYKHLDIGNIKIAFTIVCSDDLFRDVYFNSNTLYLVKSGKAIIQTKSDEFILNKGEIILIKQHTIVDIKKFKDENGDDFQSFIFQLFPDFIVSCTEKNRLDKVPAQVIDNDIIRINNADDFWRFSESLNLFFENQAGNQKELIKNKTFEAVELLVNQNKDLLNFLLQNSKPTKIDLYEFMIHNVLSNNSVEELAQLTGRSLSAFKRDFKEVFNTTPHRWIMEQKMDLAEELLTKKQMKSSDFYQFLGFEELSHFSMSYKKIKGVPPTQA